MNRGMGASCPTVAPGVITPDGRLQVYSSGGAFGCGTYTDYGPLSQSALSQLGVNPAASLGVQLTDSQTQQAIASLSSASRLTGAIGSTGPLLWLGLLAVLVAIVLRDV